MTYVKDLPKNVIDILLAVKEKQLLAEGHDMVTVFEALTRLENSKVSDIGKDEMIKTIFQ